MDSAECHFGKLSPELRNEVYSYLLPQNSTIPLLPSPENGSYPSFEGIQPPLTKVCRQIRNETKPMLYGNNKFILPLETHLGNGRYFHCCLVGSMKRVTAWLQQNPIGSSPIRDQVVITIELAETYWIHDWPGERQPWVDLLKSLQENGYSDSDYVIEAAVYQVGLGRRLLGWRNRRTPPNTIAEFRKWGLRCETPSVSTPEFPRFHSGDYRYRP
ncbi:unnamed protein product [Zymoseptoria tritici ST99CH_1E4]|uniref:2EXR domain-containing protein n=1 Tax=Zymoseptoria tritici ST99CH_1E4 TaxID=1276532 RepID=A0A2H1GUC3_ZYMTR|nr:unnamed protein product [Zymoseptoria tritici ST99CH_1E4]